MQTRSSIVMAGFDPAIHAVPHRITSDGPTLRRRVDGRVTHGHDEGMRVHYRVTR
jgi:hypothetical protein